MFCHLKGLEIYKQIRHYTLSLSVVEAVRKYYNQVPIRTLSNI